MFQTVRHIQYSNLLFVSDFGIGNFEFLCHRA